ncbi:hypothetical protein K3718_20690 (plasmid) [Leisingera aquaemixtae]|uniref:Response regulatory domain-containing protein n=1 Tax=Leisingera aquaemixtae TaxID=1396826 RepID=A0ABY5WQN2_9RHOB|nr:hypothetical protein [Leisingera aquaemixtae]UWQ43815.1 hypothetical protein K3718_20690 [Leisingera aquaemixtae]
MSTTAAGAQTPVLILTPNALEAADISDYLLRRGYPAVSTETRLDGLAAALDYAAQPHLVFFGFPLSVPAARDWLQSAMAKEWRLILINGDTTEPELRSLPMLSRPFATPHLDAAMQLLGE